MCFLQRDIFLQSFIFHGALLFHGSIALSGIVALKPSPRRPHSQHRSRTSCGRRYLHRHRVSTPPTTGLTVFVSRFSPSPTLIRFNPTPYPLRSQRGADRAAVAIGGLLCPFRHASCRTPCLIQCVSRKDRFLLSRAGVVGSIQSQSRR